MSCELGTIHALPAADFRRWSGVQRAICRAMFAEFKRRDAAKKKAGLPPVPSLERPSALTLPFWREHRTPYRLAAEWGVQESTVRRTIALSGVCPIPSRLLQQSALF